MKKKFRFFILSLVLCSCSPSNEGFIHKSKQPYYLDCEFQDEYDIEDISIKLYLGLWHNSSSFEGYSKDIQIFLFVNESTKDSYDIFYKTSSLLLKQYDYDSVANDNYVFSTNKKGNNYYISYNSYENIEIPSKVFNDDKGYISIAFSFMALEDNEFKSTGGTGLKLAYQKKDNSKISFFKPII